MIYRVPTANAFFLHIGIFTEVDRRIYFWENFFIVASKIWMLSRTLLESASTHREEKLFWARCLKDFVSINCSLFLKLNFGSFSIVWFLVSWYLFDYSEIRFCQPISSGLPIFLRRDSMNDMCSSNLALALLYFNLSTARWNAIIILLLALENDWKIANTCTAHMLDTVH